VKVNKAKASSLKARPELGKGSPKRNSRAQVNPGRVNPAAAKRDKGSKVNVMKVSNPVKVRDNKGVANRDKARVNRARGNKVKAKVRDNPPDKNKVLARELDGSREGCVDETNKRADVLHPETLTERASKVAWVAAPVDRGGR
jgi:hypothetical protein